MKIDVHHGGFMKVEYTNGTVKLNRVLTVIDTFVIDFIEILDKLDIRYVLISGYVVLLFGRQRTTEDVDIFLEELTEEKLKALFNALQKKWWILNAGSFNTAHSLYQEGIAWRAAKEGNISPNMEIKKPKFELDFFSLNHPVKVILNHKHELNISPLELQIAYKLFLGTPKDIEDAQWLYGVFKGKLNKSSLYHFSKNLHVYDKLDQLGALDG